MIEAERSRLRGARSTAEPMGAPRPLRVGARIGGELVPRWAQSVLTQLRDSGTIELAALIVDRRSAPVRSARERLRTLGYALYEAVDRRIYRDADDPFALVGAVNGTAAPTLELRRAPDTAFKEALRAHRLDVLIFFGPHPDSLTLADCARAGVWFVQHGDRAGPPYFWELNEQADTFATALVADRPDGRHVIYRSHGGVDLVSLQRGRTGPYWKTAQFFVRRLTDLHVGGWPRIAAMPGYSTVAAVPPARVKIPTNSQVLKHVARMALGVARRRTVRSLFREQWFVAYRSRGGGVAEIGDGPPFRVIASPHDRFFADPFLIERDGEAYVFCEDLSLADGKGIISYIRLTPDGRHDQPVPVLERPYHLSYPFVFEHRGEIYMLPETSGARRVELYRAVRFPAEWELFGAVLDDVQAVDPTLLQHGGRLWLFANVATPGSPSVDELFLYSAESLDGRWEPHPMNPVVSDVRRARPAGRIFELDGALIRLGQDCSGTYGRRITLNRVDELSPTFYRECEIAAIAPTWMPGNLASHTYTFSDRYEVIDARTRRAKFALLDRLLSRRSSAERPAPGRRSG